MQTELSFLLELLLEHKLPKDTRSAVAVRIKLVEKSMEKPKEYQLAGSDFGQRAQTCHGRSSVITSTDQAPSTLAALARHASTPFVDALPNFGHADRASRETPPVTTPVVAVGVTSAAAEAMATRNKLIAEAQAGIAKKGPAVGRGHGVK